ncbi:MAG: hypothetical protein ACFFCS_21135 [Candidatus Hodarchaeota archaeon]
MNAEIKNITIVCPSCSENYRIELETSVFEKYKGKGIITVALTPPCDHPLQVFIDQKGKFRGGQCADVMLDSSKIGKADGISIGVQKASDEEKDLIFKLASSIILLDTKEIVTIKSLSAEQKVDAAELSLVKGELDVAKDIFGDLAEFALDIGDEDFAITLSDRIAQIDMLMNTKGSEIAQKEIGKEEIMDRIDEIVVDLNFASMKAEIPHDAFMDKSSRLNMIKTILD